MNNSDEQSLSEIFREFLRKNRESKDLSQEQLAEKIGDISSKTTRWPSLSRQRIRLK
ncbi:hypothetical protein KSF_104930 [Reticulibacter mediterranei]|uniref:HTH cro/C1-type domain-containing protein n=1 Tax=Reticulibacter mediterranei TaxID=2778369 RepID=A0A8J3IXT3_9CHLR|nr:hypothetical protein KSF_104930 [Reticulibacter mediterranei]